MHLILDKDATHKHPNVNSWLAKHPRFHLHFTPTSSWLNVVERWFRDLTDKAIRRDAFHSVPDLIAAIENYLQANNNDPQPLYLDNHHPRHPGECPSRPSRLRPGRQLILKHCTWRPTDLSSQPATAPDSRSASPGWTAEP